MENGDLKDNFEQGLETLGDLYSLGDSSLYPLFDRLHFHFNEINSFKKNPQKVNEYKTLRRLFLQSLNDNVSEFFRGQSRGTKVDLVDMLENPGLGVLDHITAVFPLAGEVCKLFQFNKNIKIVLKNEFFSFKGQVPIELDFEKLREETYRLTRVFLKNRVLFTFNIFESSQEEGLFEIEFKFFLDDEGERPYLIPVDKNQVLRFSGVLKNFKRSKKDIEEIGKHNVFLLKEDFEVQKLDRNAFVDCYNDKNYELFHFPFLFRPISLIIKRCIYGHEEPLNESRLMPLQPEKKLEVFNIDLFEIFQK